MNDTVIVAKHYLADMTCFNCKWFIYKKSNTNQFTCKMPQRLKDDYAKWISKVIPEEQTCKWWEK